MKEIFTPVFQKSLFWFITIILNLFAFLSWSFLDTRWATPEYVDQKIIILVEEEKERRERFAADISSLQESLLSTQRSFFDSNQSILITLTEIKGDIRHIRQDVAELKEDNRDIKRRIR